MLLIGMSSVLRGANYSPYPLGSIDPSLHLLKTLAVTLEHNIFTENTNYTDYIYFRLNSNIEFLILDRKRYNKTAMRRPLPARLRSVGGLSMTDSSTTINTIIYRSQIHDIEVLTQIRPIS